MKENLASKAGNKVCVGTGLLALDVVLNGKPDTPAQLYAGGSCGNVLSILSFFGWDSLPIARLSNNRATKILLQDLSLFNVSDKLITVTPDGSTPIIIHRILNSTSGFAKHRFEFRDPDNGGFLPSYKPMLAKSVNSVFAKQATADIFYFDRVNRASLDLARLYKDQGAVVFFEPSSLKDDRANREAISISDIVKFSSDRVDANVDFIANSNNALQIQTLGADGLRFKIRDADSWIELPSRKIENVIDTAGAGDWCSAGFIHYFFKLCALSIHDISENNVSEALKFGQILSAMNCVFKGARALMYRVYSADLVNRSAGAIVDTNDDLTLQDFNHADLVWQERSGLAFSTLTEPQLF